MKKIKLLSIATLMLFAVSCGQSCQKETASRSHQELLSDFVELRHGMFICYNIMSYGAKWGEANYPIDGFNPTKLDCSQWAKAAKSANMTYALLTTKHHEGFALWDSKYNDNNVMNSPYKQDIVRKYVDAFRAEGLQIGLYYSIWDATNGIEKGSITPEGIAQIKGEITELLSNYGKVDYLVVDGWFWRMGHRDVPFIEIRELIRELQPECLITDHTHLQSIYHVDIPYFEGPFGAFPSEDNTMASALGFCPVRGNGWFWSEKSPDGLISNADKIVDLLTQCESRYCNFLLNCMPNRDGLLDPLYIDLLKEIGEKWSPDMKRKPLPMQAVPVRWEVAIESATTSSGVGEYLIDGIQNGTVHTDWISNESRKQEIILDLGKVCSDINILNFTQLHRCKPAPECSLKDGNITHSKLYVSVDGKSYEQVSEDRWTADAKMRSIQFDDKATRYLKLEILDFEGDNAIITEMQVGNSKSRIK